ncbi:MAG: PEGA domain-containing protein [Parcubacteria group bacterium]|nr:PEGA domain-containing protein [Parcubacteria group bacterium]
MGIRARRALYVFAFLCFIIFGVAVTVYASGYRYDRLSGRLTKMGAFYIKSFPSGAAIMLDQKPTHKQTPARLLNISPGAHTLTVGRPDFSTWQKNLSVKPGETNFARDIILFKEHPTATVLSAGGKDFLVSRDGNLYLFIDAQGRIHLTNTITRRDFVVRAPLAPERLLAFSPDNRTALMQADGRLFTVDINTEELKELAIPAVKLKKALWDIHQSDRLWLLIGQKLSSFDTGSNEFIERLGEIDDFTLTETELLTLSRKQDAWALRAHAPDGSRLVREQMLPTREQLRLFRADDTTILVRGERGFWIIPKSDSGAPTFIEASLADTHGQLLLGATDFELFTARLAAPQRDLLDRTAAPIKKIQWHPSGSYLLRQLGDLLQLIELDGRDRRNAVSVLTIASDFDSIFDRKGETLFILTPHVNQYLELQ